MRKVSLLIAGQDRAASNGATFDRISPVTSQVISRSAAATFDDADSSVNAAHAAFAAWAGLAPTERRRRLLKAADLLEQRTAEFVEIGTLETGAKPDWYGFNVMLAAGMLREAASMTTQITGDLIPSDIPGNLCMAVRQPCGVVLGIAPWNAPVILGVRALAMPLACGNTVVFKASEMCPAVHRLIGTVLQEAELGDGVINVVLNAPADAPAIVERLIAHPAVRRVNFTGSTSVGRIVGQLAAKYLKPALLELGGKAPMIVLDDADLNAAVSAAAFGAFFNQGQICMSTERIVVDRTIADPFIEKLAEKAASLSAGNPGDANCALGSMVTSEAAGRVKHLVEDALAKGAKVVAGGNENGSIMQATVVDHVTPEMRLYREESFGPVVTVVRANDLEHAIQVANDTEFGLSAAVFGRDVTRALAVARRIESGICHVNSSTVHDEAQMPFGGVKASGYGRFGGKSAIHEFTELRWITIQTTPRQYPI